MAANKEYWLEIMEQPCFSGSPTTSYAMAQQAMAHEWLQKLSDDGRLRQLDLIRLGALLEVVYDCGRLAGRDEVLTEVSEQRRS